MSAQSITGVHGLPEGTTAEQYIAGLGAAARAAGKVLATASTAQKNQALQAIAEQLDAQAADILAANREDLDAGRQNGLEPALLDRLTLNDARLQSMVQGIREVMALQDPVGGITDMEYRPSGIQVGRMRVPLGVVGIIYEARPNVTVDATALCLKSGNAAILRGGREAIRSNQALAACVADGLASAGLPREAVQVVGTTDRQAVGALIRADQWVDVLVPRGGKSLIERIAHEATVPVIKHLDGVCHVYIDAAADEAKAHAIAVNAKTHRYGVCNAMETLLVHESMSHLLPALAADYQSAGVALRGCERTRSVIACAAATDEDWGTEYLAPVLSIRVVATADEAMAHIARYGSRHTDAIVTENFSLARRFLAVVDSSSVIVNASTRFADGAEYGLGAEIGISTDKLHARGPVGLIGLTNQKYVVFGDGHIRS